MPDAVSTPLRTASRWPTRPADDAPTAGADQSSIVVFDFFSGCGGTSAGFREAGLTTALAIDNDPDAAATFRLNFPNAIFLESDLEQTPITAIGPAVRRTRETGSAVLFCACAPCQPFSRQNMADRNLNDKRGLLLRFLNFVAHYRPEFVFVENVPGLQDPDEHLPPFGPFVKGLRKLDYNVEYRVVDCRMYGVPQRRLRLILVASLLGPISFPRATHGTGTGRRWKTVRDMIGDLPPVAAGERHRRVKNHQAMNLSKTNLSRIRATPEGGDRRDWPNSLVLRCHRNPKAGYTDVYGRLRWDAPATGLTTRCVSLSNGRFGHPSQDRALTVREAASLQTFRRRFEFKGTLSAQAAQVGNAVPPALARRFGLHLLRHLAEIAAR